MEAVILSKLARQRPIDYVPSGSRLKGALCAYLGKLKTTNKVTIAMAM